MADSTASARDAFLAFELALDERVCDEVRRESWGRFFLTPSTPLVWDANWVGIEQVGHSAAEVVAIADEALGGAGFAHRTVCALDEADGRRLGEELEAEATDWPGWQVERTKYMEWRGGEVAEAGPQATAEHPGWARETTLAAIEGLRRALMAGEMPPDGDDLQETIDQLFEINRRYAGACEDRWFVAPAEGELVSACRLFRAGGIAQVEDVVTLGEARGNGHGKAVVLAAVAAAQAAGDDSIFLTADAADWPQLMYAKLGFEEVGNLTTLRRQP
jgi:predicted GNAT family N-acyltransferase